MKTIYLDAAATSKPYPEVVDAMLPYLDMYFHNPSALYSAGVKVKEDINKARENVAKFINAKSDEVFFTSSGSEGNNWAIQGFVNYWYDKMKTPVVITSTIEHKSIVYCVKNIGAAYKKYITVDNEGFLNIKELEDALKLYKDNYNCKVLVSIQYANNEIGTVQHIGQIAKLVHKYNAVFHVDAVQAFGQFPIDVKALDIDMLTASGHKIGAPKGIAILYKNRNTEINPLIYGSQMDEMRGGTENVPYIMAMSKAVDIAKENIKYYSDMVDLRDYFIKELENIGCTLNGSRVNRLPNNINVMLPYELSGESLLYLLDMCNIQIGIGSACNNTSILPSPVLSAIGKREDAHKAIRITFARNITKDDIDIVIKEINKQFELMKGVA